MRELTIGQQIVFFATAVSFAAGAADMSSGAVAGGFGNFGILLILIRTYFSVPLMVAGLRARDVKWAEREEKRLLTGGDLAWTALVGRAGWGLLGLVHMVVIPIWMLIASLHYWEVNRMGIGCCGAAVQHFGSCQHGFHAVLLVHVWIKVHFPS